MKELPRLLVIISLFMSSTLFSQELVFGVKGGINYNSIGDFAAPVNGTNTIFSPDSEMGYQAGAYFNLYFGYFFIRPEFNFVSVNNSYPFPTKTAQWEAQQIDIPILLGYNIYGPINIYAGPEFNFISNMEMEGWQDTSYADPFSYNASSTSVNFGVLLDFGRIGLDLRYQYGLTKVEGQRLDMIENYNGYGVNLGDLLEYNPSRIILTAHINIFIKDLREKRSGLNSDWRNHKRL